MTPPRPGPRPPTVAEALRIKELPVRRFIADPVSTVRGPLFGGQVAAQALRAASLTVSEERVAHSLHTYFLTAGDASAPVVFTVERDRDGGRYSGRRVTAHQGDAVILSMSCSFSRPAEQATEFQAAAMPTAPSPENLATYELNPSRTLDLEACVPDDPEPCYRWPARLWLRIREPLDEDPNLWACGTVFLSDLCTGLTRVPQSAEKALLTSLDHAVWLHHSRNPNEWLLIDLQPLATAGGRGLYSGQIYDQRGTVAATLAQESLFERDRVPKPTPK